MNGSTTSVAGTDMSAGVQHNSKSPGLMTLLSTNILYIERRPSSTSVGTGWPMRLNCGALLPLVGALGTGEGSGGSESLGKFPALVSICLSAACTSGSSG